MGLKDDTREHVAEQIVGKTWEELKVVEFADYLLFPEKLYRRSSDGSFATTDIYLRVPRENENRKARALARAICAKDGIDPKLDPELLDNLDVICTLSVAVRNTSDPYEPWEPDPESMEKRYDKESLIHLWNKLEVLNDVINPRPQDITEAEMLAVVAAIVKERSIAPLHVFDGPAQNTCILFMAQLCQTLVDFKLSSESSTSSTAESSPPEDSSKS